MTDIPDSSRKPDKDTSAGGGADSAQPLDSSKGRRRTEEVCEHIRHGILTGQFPSGFQFREVQFSRDLGVSRGPVREALARLETEGLVETRWHGSATVVSLSPQDIDEIYTLREALETLAVRCVITQSSDADLDALDANVEEMKAAISAGRTEQLPYLDIDFHDRLYRASHHDRLLTSWTGIKYQVALFLLARQRTVNDYPAVVAQEHAEIARVLRDRDEVRITQLVSDHLQGSYQRLVMPSSFMKRKEA